MNTSRAAVARHQRMRRPLVASAALAALLVGSATAQLAGAGHGPAVATATVANATSLDSSGQPSRPTTGSIVRSSGGAGPGVFVVENGTASDGVATLSTRARAIRSVYVRHGDTARVRNVPDGTFEIYYTLGSQWDGRSARFTVDPTYERFDRQASFTSTRTKRGVRYSIFTITLHTVPGGTATTTAVPSESYPR